MATTAKITVAREAGACYGVNRALDLVERLVGEDGGPVRTLGPLIHNPAVVSRLEERGVTVASSPDEFTGGTLVLRTHGVTPDEEARAKAAANRVIDATCPFVIRAHRAAERLDAEGYQVVVLGEAGHPEVMGTVGHAPKAIVVEGADDLDGIELRGKVGVVVQTTQSRARLRELVSALIGRAGEVRVVDTICEATSERQSSASELSSEVDVMVVVGGHNSANTCRLAEICSMGCDCVHHIESEGELEGSWFEGAQAIGVTAGASTPQSQIDAVCSRIADLSGGTLAAPEDRQ